MLCVIDAVENHSTTFIYASLLLAGHHQVLPALEGLHHAVCKS